MRVLEAVLALHISALSVRKLYPLYSSFVWLGFYHLSNHHECQSCGTTACLFHVSWGSSLKIWLSRWRKQEEGKRFLLRTTQEVSSRVWYESRPSDPPTRPPWSVWLPGGVRFITLSLWDCITRIGQKSDVSEDSSRKAQGINAVYSSYL